MIQVSNEFKKAIKEPERKIKGYVEVLYDLPNVTVTPSVAPEMKNITPSPIPNVLDGLPQVKSHSDDDSFAIPTNQVSEEDIDTVIFDQIIEELNQIKSQNAQIQESINRLTSTK